MATTQRSLTAGARLVNITELLEKILLNLSERDLLVLQRFDQIKAVTDGSIQLRRNLFLEFEEPDGSLPHMSKAFFGGPNPFINKLTPILAGPEESFMSLVPQPGETMPSLFCFRLQAASDFLPRGRFQQRGRHARSDGVLRKVCGKS